MTLETAIVHTRVRGQGARGPARAGDRWSRTRGWRRREPGHPGTSQSAKKLTDAIPGARVGRRSR